MTEKEILRKAYDVYPMDGVIDPYDGGKDINEERREGYMKGLGEMNKVAVLYSSHIEVARVDIDRIKEIICMAGCSWAQDLLRVSCHDSSIYWCDSIEFLDR